jgi:hypothetical protein
VAVSGPPDLRGLVLALAEHGVEWVLAGSVAVLAWTPRPWPFSPGDLDVVPRCSAENLERLARLLDTLGARPEHDPAWPESLSPEECAAWTPWPATEERLDHRFETSRGTLDVVPWRARRHELLRPGAYPLDTWGTRVWVAAPADLAATLRPAKPKHAARAGLIEAILARQSRGEKPIGLEPVA